MTHARQGAPSDPQRLDRQGAYELDGRRPADPDGNAEHARSEGARERTARARDEREKVVEQPLRKTTRGAVAVEDAPEGAAGRAPGFAGMLERAQQDACGALAEAMVLAAARLEVVAAPKGLILRGESPSARAKDFALRLCRNAAGAIQVRDEVIVLDSRSSRGR